MRVTFQVGNITLGHEARSVAEAFEMAAGWAEIFGEPCGCCKSKDVVPTVQKFKDKTFRKLKCTACTAELLLFGRDDGGMWAVRTDRDKQKLPNRGWSVFKPAGSSRTVPTSPPEPGGYESNGGDDPIPF